MILLPELRGFYYFVHKNSKCKNVRSLVMRFKQNIDDEVICPHEAAFLQYIGDNTDRELAMIEEENAHHGLEFIANSNGKFSENAPGKAISIDEKQNWKDITRNKDIEIKEYHFLDKPLSQTSEIHDKFLHDRFLIFVRAASTFFKQRFRVDCLYEDYIC